MTQLPWENPKRNTLDYLGTYGVLKKLESEWKKLVEYRSYFYILVL